MRRLPCCALAPRIVTAMPASAQFAKPEDAVKYRQARFTVMGFHVGRVGAMVNDKAPFDAKIAAESAANIEYLSKLPFDRLRREHRVGQGRDQRQAQDLAAERQVPLRPAEDAGRCRQAQCGGQERRPRPDQGRLRRAGPAAARPATTTSARSRSTPVAPSALPAPGGSASGPAEPDRGSRSLEWFRASRRFAHRPFSSRTSPSSRRRGGGHRHRLPAIASLERLA